MTVEHLVCPECEDDLEVELLEFCAQHNNVLDALILQRGMTDRERNAVVSTMLFGVVSFMGPQVFKQHENCPICVLEGTLERACDEVSLTNRKAN
jgi:hypothetical protein